MLCRKSVLVGSLIAALAGGVSQADDGPAFERWLTGDWMDPRVHRCDTVWVRIRIEAGRLQHYTVTFGNEVPGLSAEILAIENGPSALLYNETLGFEQRLRYVTRDAHVLEKANGAAGVTFVRCERAGEAS